MKEVSNTLLTGPPGCGKTTVVMRILERLVNTPVAGFYTREVRKGRSRIGFDAVGLSSGRSVRLARVHSTSRTRVGRYGVELSEFEELLDDEFQRDPLVARLVVIDEIGKMECYSSLFVNLVRELLDSSTPLLATIARRGTGFIDEVKRHKDVDLFAVSGSNRDHLPEQLMMRLVGR